MLSLIASLLILGGFCSGAQDEILRAVQPGREPPYYDQGQSRVVGGSDTTIQEWPWQASLRYYNGHTCGAVIISTRHLLTAAHCVHGRTSSYFNIEVGSAKRNSGKIYEISKITEHGSYSTTAGYPNDIAILETSEDMEFTDSVQSAKLPEKYYDTFNHECYITGWGKTRGNLNNLPTTLQAAKIPSIPNSECRSRMYGVNGAEIFDEHICNFDIYASTNACQGDSGGPMACKAPGEENYVVVGIASWVVTGCSGSYPSVYVRISEYLNWLQSHSVGI